MPLVSRIDVDRIGTGGEYQYKAGVSGTVTIPAGARILSWTAFAVAAGGTITIAGGDSIPVPPNGFVIGGALEPVTSSINFVFTATSGYFIEYV